LTAEQEFDESYRRAERRLRDALFGDGVFTPGHVKSQEARGLVARDLRKMREAFEGVLQSNEAALAEAGSRVADLEEELKKIAASKARKARAAPKSKSGKATARAKPEAETARSGSKPKPATRKARTPSKPRTSR
jgi:hypothetical protein